MSDPHWPLARLMAVAYRSLVEDLHSRLRERGWHDVRPSFGFVLLAARDQPVTATELAALMETTKQAASRLAGDLVEAGYLVPEQGGGDARRRPLRLSQRGRRLLQDVEAIYRELESGWAEVIGDRALERMRRDLTTALEARHGGVLPSVRPPA